MSVIARPPRPHATNDIGDFGLISIEQITLADKRVLDLVRELEPFLAPPRAEVAERANRLLARPLGRHDRLHQHIVGVGLALVEANRLADIHIHYESQQSRLRQRKTHAY